MKKSEYILEANQIIQDLFQYTLDNWTQNEWKRMISFVNDKVYWLEQTCGEWKHTWRQVQKILLSKYGKKFITKK